MSTDTPGKLLEKAGGVERSHSGAIPASPGLAESWLRGTEQSSKASVASCTWRGVTSCSSTGQGSPAGKQFCREGPGYAGGQQVDHDPAMCPCG